jgi:hypothetical protein
LFGEWPWDFHHRLQLYGTIPPGTPIQETSSWNLTFLWCEVSMRSPAVRLA